MKSKIQYIFSLLALSLTLSFGAFAQTATTTSSQKIGANPTTISPSAVLEVESSNKGVLFPRIALTSSTDVGTIASPATGLTIFNTATAGTSPNNVSPGYYYWNGSKWLKLAIETPFAKTVYVNTASPNTATIFDENNPAATNDEALKANDNNLYIGNDGSTWTYDPRGSGIYKTFSSPASTPFNLATTTTDAGSDKTTAIWRSGGMGIGINNPASTLHVQHPLPATNTINAAAPVMRLSRVVGSGVKWDHVAQFNIGSYAVTAPTSTNWNATTRLDLGLNDGNGLATSNVMTWQANGNVGIGTTAPSRKLDVNGTALFRSGNDYQAGPFSANQILFGFNGSATYQHALKTRHSSATLDGNAFDFFLWNQAADASTAVGGRSIMTLNGAGNVGIGTTAPVSTLDVNSATAASNTINADVNILKLSRPTVSGGKWGNVAQFNMGSYAITGSSALTRLDLGLNNGDNLTTSPMMTWQGNGNVGVGTTSPTQRFHIKGTNNQPVLTGTISNATLRIDGNTSHALDIGTYTDPPYGAYLQSITTSNLSSSLPLVLNPTGGNVGIGLSNPSSKLEVDGASTNKAAFNAGSGTFIDFSKSNLAYTTASAGSFTLQNIKDGGTYTLAVRGGTVGTSSFTASGFAFKSSSNPSTIANTETLYTFMVMGTTVYFFATVGLLN